MTQSTRPGCQGRVRDGIGRAGSDLLCGMGGAAALGISGTLGIGGGLAPTPAPTFRDCSEAMASAMITCDTLEPPLPMD